MGQLSRDEAGLFDRATAAAIEDRDALSSARLAAIGIDVHVELADFAAGERGSHHEEGEGHPRQASAVATRQGRLNEAPGPILAGANPGPIRSHPEGISAAALQPSSVSRPLMS
jgi:hypothetical protein